VYFQRGWETDLRTHLIFSIIAFAVISGCAKDPKAIIAFYDHEKFLREKAQYEPEIGKDLWVRIPVFLCTKPASNPEGECTLVAVTTKHFAPLVLTARALSITTAMTAFACALYFWSRLAHVVVYTLGIPVFRTLSFAAGFVAQALLVLAIFKLI
jgi:hypothetical protein